MSERNEVDDGSVTTPESPQIEAAAWSAAVDHLFAQSRLSCSINIALVGLVVLALAGHVPHEPLLIWGTLLVGVNVARMLVVRARSHSPNRDPDVWARRHTIGMCASSALWGTLVPLLMPAAPPVESLAMTLVTAGVAAGGLPLNAAVPRLYATHLVLTQAPVAATFIALGGRTYIVLALMTVGFVFTLFSAGRAYGRNLRDVNLLAHRLDGANRELERLASHDTLTELWNRQRFESALDIELERVRRYGSTCALIMLDVDHFKQVNDQYGHAAGDRVLMDLGELLAQETRAPDQVARWGGEEFMILLPETGADGAFILAERIRRRVAETRVDGPGHVTVSLGITTNSVNEERSVLLRRLDDALYEAKKNGRNCVCVEAEPSAATAGASA